MRTSQTRVWSRDLWVTHISQRIGKVKVQEAEAAPAAQAEPQKPRSSKSCKSVIQPGFLAHPKMPRTQTRAANRLCLPRRLRRSSTTSCRSPWALQTLGSQERCHNTQCFLPKTSCRRFSLRKKMEQIQAVSKMDLVPSESQTWILSRKVCQR